MVSSPTVDYIVEFGYNLISFLYILTLHIDCSHIEDVHQWRRSTAEFGLVLDILIAQVLVSNGRTVKHNFDQKILLSKGKNMTNTVMAIWLHKKESCIRISQK